MQDELIIYAKNALMEAHFDHKELGKNGLKKDRINQFGELALRGDFEAEESIINYLTANQVPIKIISEEHGIIDIIRNPRYLGVLDGIDGTNQYAAFMNGDEEAQYGTVFGIFDNLDPKYGDYIFCGVMEHATGKLFYAVRGLGSFVFVGGKRKVITSSDSRELNAQTRIYIDSYWDFNQKTFIDKLKGLEFKDPKSAAVYNADLASGKVDLVLECTKKDNLEKMGCFGLIHESGGVVLDGKGENIVDKKFLKFGQGEDNFLPLISASTEELALKALKYFF